MRKEAVLDNARYQSVFGSVSEIINVAKVSAARSVNVAMTAALAFPVFNPLPPKKQVIYIAA